MEGSASNVAHSDGDCSEASLSVAGSVDNDDACLMLVYSSFISSIEEDF